MGRVQGKVALVTGGASGIGLSSAILLAKEGAKVVIADFNVDGAKEAAEQIRSQGGEASGIFLDASQEDSIREAVEWDVVRSAYGASKAAVVNLTRYIAVQYGRDKIRCNGVAPGLILTPAAQKNMPPAVLEIFQKFNALPYHGEADDIGYTVLFLASDESKFITGQTIKVEGGHYMANPSISDFNQYMLQVQGK